MKILCFSEYLIIIPLNISKGEKLLFVIPQTRKQNRLHICKYIISNLKWSSSIIYLFLIITLMTWGGGGNGIYILDNYFDVSSIISIYYVGLDSGAMGYV